MLSGFVIATRVLALALLLLSAAAFGQVDGQQYSYLLRLQHETYEGSTCALLQKNGAFHLEWGDGDSVKVAEGKMDTLELRRVENDLRSPGLETLTQDQIEEPLISTRDVLKISIFRRDHWQDLMFSSAESQEPYRKSLQPLLRWLDGLHRSPHKDLSEDAGKNNCLPRTEIALKKRSQTASPEGVLITPQQPVRAAPKSRVDAPPEPSVPVLLRLLSMSKTASTAQERCVLVKNDGSYRTELRAQKEGSKDVRTKVDGGMMAPPEVAELREILADPALSSISHHKTSRLVLPISGEMLQLQIPRTSGVQDVVLSATFGRRDVPFFYSGDGDISSARRLLQFLAEHVENNQSGSLDYHLRNQCTDAP